MESRIRPFAVVLLILTAVSVPIGCAQRNGCGWTPNRFWELGTRTSPDVACGSSEARGLVPRFMGDAGGLGSEDPFLNENLADAGRDAGLWQTAEADAPRIATANSEDLASAESQPTFFHHAPDVEGEEAPAGNPFRLVEHQPAVNEISSNEKPFPPPPNHRESADGARPIAGRDSQLDRLKVALSRDAHTPLPPPPARHRSEAARQRVEAMMKNARRQMHLGEFSSAVRWATAAEQLAERSGLFFGPEEDPPADLVRILEDQLRNSPQTVGPAAKAMAESSLPVVVPAPSPEPPELSVEFPPDESGDATNSPPGELALERSPRAQSTHAMQEAAIASETMTARANSDEPNKPAAIDPAQRHDRSLKVDARRVNANRGAAVSVAGQLNPPAASSLPKLEWAPPADEEPEPPPFELAMAEPAHPSTSTPPPLPPPNSVKAQEPQPPGFLYADPPPPPRDPVRNVEWGELETPEAGEEAVWWAFPAMGIAGLLLIAWLLVKRKRT